jgi:antibiotic biosynthesis monooxygenase (ABM) superfamily enzyme
VPDLTGDFPTGRLPKIAPGAVTVAITRTINPLKRAVFEQWCHDMTLEVQKFPGCLGATVLWPARSKDPYQMVFRFVDALHLRQWEKSDQRAALREIVDQFIISEKVTVTAGTEEFFNALGDVEHHRTKVGKFIFDVAWIYPISLFSALVLSPYLGKIDVIPRVLISTVVIGATSKYFTAPVRKWWRRRRMLPQNQELR